MIGTVLYIIIAVIGCVASYNVGKVVGIRAAWVGMRNLVNDVSFLSGKGVKIHVDGIDQMVQKMVVKRREQHDTHDLTQDDIRDFISQSSMRSPIQSSMEVDDAETVERHDDGDI